MSAALELQRRLNFVRSHRHPEPLAPIEETGRPDQDTRNALRAFQHEYNMLVGRKVLMERGQLDHDTEDALLWVIDLLRQKEKAA